MNDEILQLNQRLLDSIASKDWNTYRELSDPSLSAFEPEALAHLVRGLEFHQFYFELPARAGVIQTTMASPEVRVIGEVAVVAYVRLLQQAHPDGGTTTASCQETRVWQLQNGQWRQVHFHRSLIRG